MNHIAALLLLAPVLAVQAGPRVVGLSAATSGGSVVVSVALTGPAAPSAPVLLENPLRLYVDIPGARPGSQRLLNVNAGGVSRVRVALNRQAPPVTRVVIELTARTAWKLERAEDGREVRVIIGSAPAPSTGRGALIFQPAPAPAPAPPLAAPADRRERIRSDLRAMTGALGEMRAWTGPSDADLATMIAALERLSADARGLQITGTAPDIALVAAVDAALAAATARAQALADGTPQSRLNAVSAASGALMLIDHLKRLID